MNDKEQPGTDRERLVRLLNQSFILWDDPVPMMVHDLPAGASTQASVHRPHHLHRTNQLHRPMPVRCFGH
jgi:hypothetical protein